MPDLALILFAPWFAIFGWACWHYPKSHLPGSARRRFDALVLGWLLRGRLFRLPQ